MLPLVILLLVFSLVDGGAIPSKEHKPLNIPLSEKEHYNEEDHNPDFDHEAFMGEEAKAFDDLTPEESKERLAVIIGKIDKDKDGFVVEKELQEWIQYTQRRYIYEDVERQWSNFHKADESKLSWEEYENTTYGFLHDGEGSDMADYAEMISRDKNRFKSADQNEDNVLTQAEFSDFLHPEEAKHMRDIVVHETMMDIDKDKDGFVSRDEYLADMYHPDPESKEPEPDWLESEREQFAEYRDKNKDGKMDFSEVRDWIIPPDYDHSDAETKHLIFEADADKDGKLTKEEILERYDVFVGSQATDFGEALMRHDEF